VITSSPVSQTVRAGSNVTFSLQATGSGVLRYQWRFDEANIPGATQSMLTLTNVQSAAAGRYDVVVQSDGGVVSSGAAELVVERPPTIHRQPIPATVPAGQGAQFSVLATSGLPMEFQWRRDGVELPGATATSLSLPASPQPVAGAYDVVIRNYSGSVTSAPAALVISGGSLIEQPPVPVSGPEGGTATFSVALTAAAAPPFTYTWRKDGQPINTHTSDQRLDFLTLTDLRGSDAGMYSVAVSHNSTTGEASAAAALTVLPDADGDGMPNAYEEAHGFDPNSPADAALDADGDGASNVVEYRSGTNPGDEDSALRLEAFIDQGDLRLRFTGATDRTYSVLKGPSVLGGNWAVLKSLPAVSGTNGAVRLIELGDWEIDSSTRCYYRVVSPATAALP
jgi:hypothetical protein